ncbi:ABC transporter permease [Curtobacterium sp. MCJR17_055]|uniref:ABC transporter permease n=1 Tax=unclassified Curtobacterium TaxID=257496 RepID=UPI000D8F04B2|nr:MULTISPECIES: ABC transporter permease subunit [unclassified Curtobacterium]PYY33555.1 ABC transporter permease [Curtobacterium sp. MCBD17_029]PYY53391.1 ABC transporter permease [Curtobacterium sp. MCJR17_055]PYY57317.1 ABC transporter permease [Curtobacterium sp. MCPF17_015]PZE91183.1 ABC transporter permease [Curtobacterium sp. MCBD17_008]WIB14865.1 ABC transporter permease subunit [Curtobacterium sp. MCPF17_050]
MVTLQEVADARTARTAARRSTPRTRRSVTWWQPVVVLAVLVGVWYAAAAYYDHVRGLAFLVPYPHLVLKAIVAPTGMNGAPSTFGHDLWTALGRTTVVSLTGLLFAIVIGVLWAMAMAQAKWLENSLYPYAVVLQCVPILALVPLIGALFGYEFTSRVIVTVMIALFPMVSNTLFGLQSADKGQRELFRLQRAGRFAQLVKLQVPAALPSIFVGLRTSAGLSVIGAIVGDQFFQRGNPGLGVLIQVTASRLMGPELYATIIIASLYGVAVFLVFGLLGRLAVGRWHDFG